MVRLFHAAGTSAAVVATCVTEPWVGHPCLTYAGCVVEEGEHRRADLFAEPSPVQGLDRSRPSSQAWFLPTWRRRAASRARTTLARRFDFLKPRRGNPSVPSELDTAPLLPVPVVFAQRRPEAAAPKRPRRCLRSALGDDLAVVERDEVPHVEESRETSRRCSCVPTALPAVLYVASEVAGSGGCL